MPKLKNSNATFWVIFKHCAQWLKFEMFSARFKFSFWVNLEMRFEKHFAKEGEELSFVLQTAKTSKSDDFVVKYLKSACSTTVMPFRRLSPMSLKR